jgi:thiol-disulfide isomerase/thioredoxin
MTERITVMRQALGHRTRVSLVWLLVLGIAMSGCAGIEETGTKGYVAGGGGIVVVPASERTSPATAAGETLEGRSLSLEELRGKPVVVNIWSSWCGPCRGEQPLLNTASEELSGRAVFVGVNIRENSLKTALAYARKAAIPYESIHSPDSAALLGLGPSVMALGMPATVVLDREGHIAAMVSGAITSHKTLVDLVDDVELSGR